MPNTPFPTADDVCDPPLSVVERIEALLEIVSQVSSLSDIEAPTTPQFEAFQWLSTVDDVCPEDRLDVVQRYILAVLYFSTDGENWENCRADGTGPCPAAANRYLSSSNVCQWFETECDVNGEIESIGLDDNSLSGVLPSELVSLQRLRVLQFDLNGGIGGMIPDAYGDLSNLRILDLEFNALTGAIPENLYMATSLVELSLNSNFLVGDISPSVGDLQMLDVLQLDNNMIQGEIPPEIGELESLSFLTVNTNEITGVIPQTLANNTRLRTIAAQQNELRGPIPSFLGDLELLETINLFDNFLTGMVPSQLGRLTNLENLFLHFNFLTGTMPDEICALRRAGTLVQLTADCLNATSAFYVECVQGECCTACF